MVSGVRIVDMLMIIGWWDFFLQAKEEAPELMAQKSKLEEEKIAKEKEVTEAWAAVEARLREVGNLVHDSVPVDNNEVCSAQRIGASRVLGFMVFFFLRILEVSFNSMGVYVVSWSSMISHWLFLNRKSLISFYLWSMCGGSG